MTKKATLITVTSARDDNKVVLWEVHSDHPEGEVFVAGAMEKQVAETPLVLRRLSENQLVKVGAKVGEKRPASTKAGATK